MTGYAFITKSLAAGRRWCFTGLAAKLGVHEHARRDPLRLRKRPWRGDGLRFGLEPLEHRQNAFLVIVGETAFQLARVDEPPALLATEVQAVKLASFLRPTDRHEGFAQAAMGARSGRRGGFPL